MTNPFNNALYLIFVRDDVWDKGTKLVGQDPAKVRRDEFGYIIHRDDYGDRKSPFGWEIDHILPKSRGGSDELSTLRPLHWRVNSGLGGLLSRS